MASLLGKIQTLISADLNRLVDRSLDANDPAIFQQHIRELQKMQEQLSDQLVNLRARRSRRCAARAMSSRRWSLSKTLKWINCSRPGCKRTR